MPNIIVSCVIDNKPKFHMQGWNWLCSLHACGALDHVTAIVHHVGTPPEYFSKAVSEFGAKLEILDAFGTGPAVYCNKLQSFSSLARKDGAYYILTDADLFFGKSPAALCYKTAISAKLVDRANPTYEVLRVLLDRAQMFDEPINANPTFQIDKYTHRFNCNGGIYIVPGEFFVPLTTSWVKWSRFCLNQEDLLEERTIHSDQLGFMCAMIETQFPFEHLTDTSNFPLHFQPKFYDQDDYNDVDIIHYHWLLDQNGKISIRSFDKLDTMIEEANEVLKVYDDKPLFRPIQQAYEKSLSLK